MTKNINSTVGIIGCGWLGKPLAMRCSKALLDVTATAQSNQSLADLSALNINNHRLSLPIHDDDKCSYPVFESDVIVICIPPKLRKGHKDYAENIQHIVQRADKKKVKKIILISSTAVYDGHKGQVDEDSPLHENLEKVAIIAQAEKAVLDYSRQSIVLRCAGLVGADRHPGAFLKSGRTVSAPNAYVNLVHQDDVIEQLLVMITREIAGGIYNCVSDMQVTKQHFYEVAAKALGKPIPQFDCHSELELGKQVLGHKIRLHVNVPFIYDDLIAWLAKG